MALFHPSNNSRGLSRIGVLWKRMQICRPSCNSMYMKFRCAHCGEYNLSKTDGKVEKIANDGGLTFGDLYKKAEDIFRRSGQCPVCDNSESTMSFVYFKKATDAAIAEERDNGYLREDEAF